MRIRIGSPFLLTIISIFSILFFATSIAAQQASDMSTMGNSSGMPPMGNSSGMPPVGGQSPAQNALALAQAAKLAADQQVNTAQGTLESAQSAVQTAQQTLTTAQETLASATSALQEAESAVEAETQQKAELIRVAEQAVQEAEQNLQTAQQELDSARSALQELEQQIATAQGTVTTAESKQQELNTLLLQAQAEVARLMGNSGIEAQLKPRPIEDKDPDNELKQLQELYRQAEESFAKNQNPASPTFNAVVSNLTIAINAIKSFHDRQIAEAKVNTAPRLPRTILERRLHNDVLSAREAINGGGFSRQGSDRINTAIQKLNAYYQTLSDFSPQIPTVQVQSLGQTFATYQPPDIACEKPGGWAAVDASGNGIKQGSRQRVNFIVLNCDTPGPGEAGKFNGIPGRAPDSYRYVFANTEQAGLPGEDAAYNFDTGIWTTSIGTFLDGKQVNVK
jgi:hypothetical protein